MTAAPQPPPIITCVECGGEAHLLTEVPDDAYVEPGTSFPYRCSDCLDRFDVVWDQED